MVDKVEIDDPYKVDPSLEQKSIKQLKHEITLREMAVKIKERAEKIKEFEAKAAQINAEQEAFVNSLLAMERAGTLPDGVKAAYMTTSGTFAPHLKHRAVTAEQLLARQEKAEKPKRTRKAKS